MSDLKQLLREVLDGYNLSYGGTDNGAAWCVKALHPSDPTTVPEGVPDMSSIPSVLVNYQFSVRVVHDPAQTQTWGYDLVVTPHPIMFGAVQIIDGDDDPMSTGTRAILNEQLVGETHDAKLSQFLTYAQRWRLAYASVTIVQDGPDLANQGTIASAQPVVEPRLLWIPAVNGGLNYSVGANVQYDFDDRPNFAKTQSMPGAYLARSREGLYLPLKLNDHNFFWHSARDMWAVSNFHPDDEAHTLTGSQRLASSQGYNWPWLDSVVQVDPSLTTGTATPCMMQSRMGFVCARGMSVETSHRLFFRVGLEIQPTIGSSLSPMQKMSPRYDRVALESYFAISRELKDAYPADYNDLQKMWSVIKRAADAVLPLIPGPVRPAVKAVTLTGDAIAARRARTKARRKQKRAVAVATANTPFVNPDPWKATKADRFYEPRRAPVKRKSQR